MAEVTWTPQAAGDLESITEFIAADSPHYASLFAIDVIGSALRLNTFPEMGRMVPEMQESSIRELILGNYRLIYRAKESVVEILSVYHGSPIWTQAA